MAESLFELLSPRIESLQTSEQFSEQSVAQYLTRLSTFSIEALKTTEPESLEFDAQSSIRSLQALSKRSYKTTTVSAESLSQVKDVLPNLFTSSDAVHGHIPGLESKANAFAEKYAKGIENPILDRRKRAMRLGENVNKLADILELPSLLTSTIAASTATPNTTQQNSSSANASYATALDLYAHIKRLQRFYPSSELVRTITLQADDAMRNMTTNLISSLRAQSLKLAGALRLVGLLRRVAPELDDSTDTKKDWSSGSSEGSLGALFLVCRLFNLNTTLDALEPLRELADAETASRDNPAQQNKVKNAWAAGQQSEKYLKRYIEVFREQCFAIVSTYKSIFPTSLPGSNTSSTTESPAPKSPSSSKPTLSNQKSSLSDLPHDQLLDLPPALSTFTFDLVDQLIRTLKAYLPNVRDRSSRDSLLTQILYCAGSLGRLGGDFSMMLALLEDDLDITSSLDENEVPEWIDVVKKHRVQASRLELLASGVGSGRATSLNSKAVTSAG